MGTKDSATQLLADRLCTHKNPLSDDISYQAARKKDPARRLASASEFALSKAQSLWVAMLVTCICPAAAQPFKVSAVSFDSVDFWICLFTALLATPLVELL